jgi:Icc protein
LVKDKFTMVNSSSVNEPLTLDPSGAEVPIGAQNSEGLYVTVYADRVSIQGRDFYKKEWISQAQFSVPVNGTVK